MMASKEQERAALAKIRRIVEGLGENSYIGMALEGCLEDAEENIENDFGQSWKQRAESAREEAAEFKRAAEHFSSEADRYMEEASKLKEKVLTVAECGSIKAILNMQAMQAGMIEGDSAKRIVEAADNPESEAFRVAVSDHRNAKSTKERCEKLIQRLLEVMNA